MHWALSWSSESRNSTGPDTWKGSQAKRRSVQLSNGIWATRKDHSKDLHNDEKPKLSSDSGQHGEEGQDQEWSGSVLWPAMRKTLDSLANKNKKKNYWITCEEYIYIYIYIYI